MKNLINISFLTFIFSALIAACTGQGKLGNASQQQLSTEDSVIVTDSEIVSGRVIEDTVIGYWTVKTTKDSNEVVVGRDDWAVRDSSVFLTLSYGIRPFSQAKKYGQKMWSATKVNI